MEWLRTLFRALASPPASYVEKQRRNSELLNSGDDRMKIQEQHEADVQGQVDELARLEMEAFDRRIKEAERAKQEAAGRQPSPQEGEQERQ